ncbi:YceD family protein [Heyndrickxia ginsengihumi]|uniref:DUF177 domain-containing protein n=1 Tax=Heyndrickxia ginsengihumi TaxID=363870 RepID=A0A0A6VDR9_9BACI|nr:YceD family protein [Heyndrickxia ginsengihumi]KHD84689.1 hypothetical protein NG54_13895 [Heyndrickxia ginsengihumi]MBE6183681.1 DUF177 domain-containing protein [Bacillus sp. (in: firmicutes)]MCM3022391.1 YceD family protein [Heyndrickxia ginsengihumi]NEY18667.1 DUF177 domain-containing protein [Heyndrickxia ginsengihumi]
MKWSTIQLQKFRDKSIEIDENVDVTQDLKKLNSDIRDASPFHITGNGRVTSDKVTFQIHIDGNLVLPCSRTLVDVNYPIDIESTETFLLKPITYDGLEDEEVHRVDGEVIDLVPVIKELILLDIPIQVFSDEAKDDQLPHTENWQVITEDQYEQLEKSAEKAVDPRLSDLAKFFSQDSEK